MQKDQISVKIRIDVKFIITYIDLLLLKLGKKNIFIVKDCMKRIIQIALMLFLCLIMHNPIIEDT